MSDPVQRLLELAEIEHTMVAEHRFEELAPVHDERDRVLATLPSPVAVRQEPALARAQALLHQATAMAAAARVELAAELARLDRGRATARGYGAAGLMAAPSVDHVG